MIFKCEKSDAVLTRYPEIRDNFPEIWNLVHPAPNFRGVYSIHFCLSCTMSQHDVDHGQRRTPTFRPRTLKRCDKCSEPNRECGPCFSQSIQKYGYECLWCRGDKPTTAQISNRLFVNGNIFVEKRNLMTLATMLMTITCCFYKVSFEMMFITLIQMLLTRLISHMHVTSILNKYHIVRGRSAKKDIMMEIACSIFVWLATFVLYKYSETRSVTRLILLNVFGEK